MDIYIYICTHLDFHLCICMCTCLYVYTYAYTYIYIYIYTYTQMHIYIHIYIYIYIHKYTHICTYIHTHAHTHIYIYIYIYIYMYTVYIYIYIYICNLHTPICNIHTQICIEGRTFVMRFLQINQFWNWPGLFFATQKGSSKQRFVMIIGINWFSPTTFFWGRWFLEAAASLTPQSQAFRSCCEKVCHGDPTGLNISNISPHRYVGFCFLVLTTASTSVAFPFLFFINLSLSTLYKN